MNCPECGEPSTWISDRGEMATCVGYFSPPGHNHDDNCRRREYGCKNGHNIVVVKRNRCPAPDCDWKGKADCSCHRYPQWSPPPPPLPDGVLGEISSNGGTTVCFAQCASGGPYPHHHIRGEKHDGGTCDDCVKRENRIPFVEEWPTDDSPPQPEPDPIMIWLGRAVTEDTCRVVAYVPEAQNPNDPSTQGWHVAAERMAKDALGKEIWLPIPRAAGPTTEYEVSEEYARVLEAALTAIGERMNRVREKTKEQK